MTHDFLSVRALNVTFDIHQGKKFPWSAPQKLRAVNDISFDLQAGQTLGIVGESGCGKSTLIRAICGLVKSQSGDVYLGNEKINYTDRASIIAAQKQMSMIFQDPIASLNPRMTVRETVSEPLILAGEKAQVEKHVCDMLDRVGIPAQNMNRYPHEFSGGQCQRIGIARALITNPKLLLCDEPVSALDVSVQAQVVNLLKELQAELNLTMVFVAHDLGVVRHISDQIMVMYLGGMMEYAAASELINSPRHPYTKALLSAVPVPDPAAKVTPQILEGDLPSPLDLPKGCLFSTRCPNRLDKCQISKPAAQIDGIHINKCWLEGEAVYAI